MALTYAQKQMAKRRSGDINRLTSDYQRAVEQFKTNVGGKEQAFQAEMAKFNEAFGGYEQRSTAYQKRLLDYMDKMKAYQAAPMQEFRDKYGYTYIPRLNAYSSSETQRYSGQQYGPKVASGPFIGEMVRDPNAEQAGIPTYAFRLKEGYEFSGGTIFGKSVKSPGEFTEKFEEQAPAAPTAMDISAERTALQGEKDYTEREIEERKKARLRAVGRGTQRGMLSAGTNISAKE
jgi:hypothetical protein